MSVFSEIPSSEWIASNRSAFAIRDRFPVTEGHTLVISRREIATWWDASRDEQIDLMDLVAEVKDILDTQHGPDGYNVGFNAGAAAGQTVDHLHVHVIPRRHGDVEDPRGGVRHVIPELGNYLAARPADMDGAQPERIKILSVPMGRDTSAASAVDGVVVGGVAVPAGPMLIDSRGPHRLHHELIQRLRSPDLDRIDLLVSFIMKSGLRMIRDRLDETLARGSQVRVLTTDYLNVTDADALADLLDMSESHQLGAGDLAIRVFSDPLTSFHPKAYLFHSSDGGPAAGFVGSSNLSRSGIETGVEWSLGVDRVGPLVESFDQLWADPRSQPLDHDFLRIYRSNWHADAGQSPRGVEIDIEVEAPAEPVAPRPIQIEALEALTETRKKGYDAGLVVMATGLGKTWLAAFDSVDLIGAGGGSRSASAPSAGTGRVLFIAHREEILAQSRDVYRQVAPSLELGSTTVAKSSPTLTSFSRRSRRFRVDSRSSLRTRSTTSWLTSSTTLQPPATDG